MNKYIVILLIVIFYLIIFCPNTDTNMESYINIDTSKNYNLPSCHILNNKNTINLTYNKEITKQKLSLYGIPVAKSIYLKYDDISNIPTLKLKNHIIQMMVDNKLSYPVVMKPAKGECGKGIVTSINNIEQLMKSIMRYINIEKYKMDLLIEQQHNGKVYRILYVNKKLIGIIERDYPIVIGDDIHTISQLVAKLNKNYAYGDRITINSYFIKTQGYNLHSVLEKGKVCAVTNKLDFTGGRQKNIPIEQIHPENKKMFDYLFNKLNINCVGVDYISTDITKPYYETDGIILELNSRPDRIIHNKIDPVFKNRYMKEYRISKNIKN